MGLAKQNILNKIKESKLAHTGQVFSVSANAEIYKPILPNAETCFKNELESISGKCEIFDHEDDLLKFLKDFLSKKNISIEFIWSLKMLQ